MRPTIHTTLNPAVEILGLIYMCHNPKLQEKSAYMDQARELGINGTELYKKYGTLLDRYIAAFTKHAVIAEADGTFFTEDSISTLLFSQVLFAELPEWVEDIESVAETEVSAELMEGIRSHIVEGLAEGATTNDLIDALGQSGLSSGVCWQFLRLIQHPKEQLTRLAEIIRKNLSAYEYALTAVEKPLKKQMERFVKTRGNMPKSRVQELAKHLDEVPLHTITPMLINPGSEIIVEGHSFAGLFVDEIFQMIENLKKAHSSNPVLKAIGDSSKFDILVALGRAPKYNLELAEHLGLSAATVSHHMQTLILHGLVSVEKRDGRVYYTLEKDPIREIISDLQAVFDI